MVDARRPRTGRRRPQSDQSFSTYLSFGGTATVVLGCFLSFYALLLLGLFPLLRQSAPTSTAIHRGDVLKPVVHTAVENVKKHIPKVEMLTEGVGALRRKINDLRQESHVTDGSLLQKAAEEFETLRKSRNNANSAEATKKKAALVAPIKAPEGSRPGVMILGMHRSGTSMLSGLMVTGQGYKVGGPLIGGAFDNEKGFFELIDVVLQNDEFMRLQRVWWSAGVKDYDAAKGLAAKTSGEATFKHGVPALAFLNDPKNVPYLQKDPRMCITLPTWLPLLTNEPAVVFTYRHPLEVALSLKKREKDFTLEHGLRLWIVYNMRGIQNSQSLCRVTSSNEAILADPKHEINRISQELTDRCGVPQPERELDDEDVARFVDTSLQHNKKQREEEDGKKKIVAEHGDCQVHDYESDQTPGTTNYEREHKLYFAAMKMYCDFQNGSIYEDGYEWPDLE